MSSAESQIAWAAGLFEGEGTIGFDKQAAYPRLALVTTDLDVVDRFCEIVGLGKVYNIKTHGLGTKPQFRWCVGSIGDVREVARMFMPYLGKRRRARLLEVLDLYNTSKIPRKPPWHQTRRRIAA